MALSKDLQRLRDSFSPYSHLCDGSQATKILLKENDPASTVNRVEITNLDGDWFAFAPDKGYKECPRRKGEECKLISPLLATGEELYHHRACDCVIVTCCDQKLTVVYIEMKSTNPDKGRYTKQLKSTHLFMQYAISLLRELHESELCIVSEKYVVLHGSKRMPHKRQSRHSSKNKLGKPEETTTPEAPYLKRIQPGKVVHFDEFLYL